MKSLLLFVRTFVLVVLALFPFLAFREGIFSQETSPDSMIPNIPKSIESIENKLQKVRMEMRVLERRKRKTSPRYRDLESEERQLSRPLRMLDECTEIRLDQNGGSMADSPVRDQGNLGICYAHMAAQLIDGWRFFHGDQNSNHLTSPLAIAASYTAEVEKFSNILNINAGDAQKTLEFSLMDDSCSDNIVQRYLTPQGEAALVGRLYLLYKNFQRDFQRELELRKAYDGRPWILGPNKSFDSRRAEALACRLDGALGDEALNALANDVFRILKNNKGDLNLLTALLESACQKKNRKQIRPPGTAREINRQNRVFPRKSFARKISEQLRKGLPVGIGYCSGLLTRPSFRPHRRGRELVCLPPKDGKEVVDGHASVLIGRRMRNGKCQLLLRNSWGVGGCAYYSSDRLRESGRCEGGDLWIDQDELIDATFNINWIE